MIILQNFIYRLLRRILLLLNSTISIIENIQHRIIDYAPEQKSSEEIKDEYLNLQKISKQKACIGVDKFENTSKYKINEKWIDELALFTQVVKKKTAVNYNHGRVLYTALSEYINKIKLTSTEKITILETGTARGFSSLCMAKALHDNKIPGNILTFDVISHLSPMYWNTISDLEGKKTRKELLKSWEKLIEDYIIFFRGDTRITMPRVFMERINFVFLDGAHTFKDVIKEYSHIKNRQKKGDIIIFDDYSELNFKGIVTAANNICDKYGYEKKIINSLDSRAYLLATKI